MAKRLYVGNLPYDITSESLRDLFSQAGTVESATVITDHGPYQGVSGWFAISGDPPTAHRTGTAVANSNAVGLGGRDAAGNPGDQTEAANSLCSLGRANAITCAVVASPGKHDWPFAAAVFTASLPWLSGQIDTPEVPHIPLALAAPTPAPPVPL